MESSGPHAPDDWFDEPEPADSRSARVDRIVRERGEREDWLRQPTLPARTGTGIPTDPRVFVIAGLVACFFLGILAAAGVFSSSSRPAALPTSPTRHVVTPTAATTTAKPTLAVPTTLLKPGETGASVEKLQRALTLAGHSPGRADGTYGNATTQAVKSFQAAHGLTADGIAGPKTLAALENTVQSG
jgi:hypothetical protein